MLSDDDAAHRFNERMPPEARLMFVALVVWGSWKVWMVWVWLRMGIGYRSLHDTHSSLKHCAAMRWELNASLTRAVAIMLLHMQCTCTLQRMLDILRNSLL